MGRCIADYVKRSVGFEIADTENVSPLRKNKEKLDCIIMRSSVFVADVTHIALRSRNQIWNIWFGFGLHFLFNFGSRRCVSLFSAMIARQKLTQSTVKTKNRSKGGGSQSINYIYKRAR